MISQLKQQFAQWLLKQPDVLMVAWNMKTDGTKQHIILRGDRYPVESGFYQFSLTGKCGYFNRDGVFSEFRHSAKPVFTQVDIFG